MTLTDLVGKTVKFKSVSWNVHNGGYMHDNECYLEREIEIRGCSHPSGYRYGHSRRLSRYLPKTTPVESGAIISRA